MGRAHDIDVPLRAENSSVSYSPHFDQLWLSVLISVHYKREEFTMRGESCANMWLLVKYLQDSLILCSFSKS